MTKTVHWWSWHNLPTGGHGHVICMLEYMMIIFFIQHMCAQYIMYYKPLPLMLYQLQYVIYMINVHQIVIS